VAYYVVPSNLVEIVEKRILAAELLGVAVVLPSWVEQCNKSPSHVPPATEFAVKGSLRATSASPLMEAQPSTVASDDAVAVKPVRVVEEAPAAAVATVDSLCNSVGTDNIGFQPVSHASENGNLLQHALVNSKDVDSLASASALIASMSRTRSAESLQQQQQQRQQPSVTVQPAILLPSFREIVPPVVPAEVLEKVQKRRRSERICDLIEDDSDEEFFSAGMSSSGSGKRAKGSLDPESWEAVSRISALQELPVIYEPGQEGDVLVIAPIVPSAAASSCSKRAAPASGIQGLSVRGKKDSRGAPPPLSAKAAKVVIKAEKTSKTSSIRTGTGRRLLDLDIVRCVVCS
jgi:hypothetical protein